MRMLVLGGGLCGAHSGMAGRGAFSTGGFRVMKGPFITLGVRKGSFGTVGVRKGSFATFDVRKGSFVALGVLKGPFLTPVGRDRRNTP